MSVEIPDKLDEEAFEFMAVFCSDATDYPDTLRKAHEALVRFYGPNTVEG